MRKITFLIYSILLVLPSFALANTCSSPGVTVVYVNGIFTDNTAAASDKNLLKKNFVDKTKRTDVEFINGFNPSHVAGIDDLITSTMQGYQGASLDYDLVNILNQVHSQLQTQKILLVGHSQGTFYSNAAYDYLVKNGVPKESIAVYNIATPADRVAGSGNYLTSSTDKVISTIVAKLTSFGSARRPLKPNIDIKLSAAEEQDPFGGHSLSEVYLNSVPDRIIGDMNNELNTLAAGNSQAISGCFNPPPATLAHKITGIGFTVVDGGISGVNALYNMTGAFAQFFYNGFAYVYNIGSADALNLANIFQHPELFVASLNQSAANISSDKSTTGNSQDTANTTTSSTDSQTDQISDTTNGNSTIDTQLAVADDNQDLIDNLLERIDLLKRQIADLTNAQDATIQQDDTQNTANDNANNDQQNQNNQNDQGLPDTQTYTYTSGGGGSRTYPKLLISEAQIAGLTDAKEEFVELYNPNNDDVDLTGWYVQRKTKTATTYASFVTNTLFDGKKISAHGYFLIPRQGYFTSLADIFVDNSLTNDNSLFLKNPNGDVIDTLGWGAAQGYETVPAQNPAAGQSIGRKFANGNEQDTESNAADFEYDIPTPKAQNTPYVSTTTTLKDTLAPVAVFNLAPIQNNLAFTVNVTVTDVASGVTPSGVAGYTFRWKEESGNWQEDAHKSIDGSPITFQAARDFTGSDEKNYYFQVKTKDVAGNESDWLPEIAATTKVSLFKKVLINEIQIAGKTTKDEFVELYNPNNVDMNLKGFALKKKNSSGAESNLVSAASFTGTIGSHGFFLIAPQANDDGSKNYTGLAAPDLYYSGKNFSLAADNTVLLYDVSNALLDKVGFGNAKDFETASTVNPDASKSIERKKLGLDTDNNADDFKISDQISPGGSFPVSTIQDSTDYVANPASNSSPGAPTYNLLITWGSAASNIDFYQVQYKLNDSSWSDWISKTTQTQEHFRGVYSLLNDNVYHFRVRAQDTDGNVGDWAETSVDIVNPIVINEVGYVGTNADPNDQWIELYNKSDNDIDLTGWKIISGTQGTDTLNLSLKGTILAKGYFMLERNDDNVLSNVLADQLFASPLGQDYLYLRAKNNRYVDQLYMDPSEFNVNNFINNGNHYSVERVSPYSFGIYSKNWKVNNGKIFNGSDRNGSQVHGTPGNQNSVYGMYTYYNASFIQDTDLKKEFGPYLFTKLHVSKDVVLSVEPGTVLKFYDDSSDLTIDGTLSAQGTPTQKIMFTSFYDDEYGGDSNGDANASVPDLGNWIGLYFSSDSQNSSLENVTVRYAGAGFGVLPEQRNNALWVDHSSISLKNSLVEKYKNSGLLLENSNSVIDGSTFINLDPDNWAVPDTDVLKGIYVQGGAPEIKNSDFQNNFWGIYVNSFYDQTSKTIVPATPTIENNNFTRNDNAMYWGQQSYLSVSGNKASGNIFNAILFASDISKDMTLQPDLPYLVKGIALVPKNTTLSLQPGVVMDFIDNWAGIQIDGTLKAIGSPDSPITFRPYYYDQDWVLPGNWAGLRFTKTSQNSDLEYINISLGGAFYNDPGNQNFTSAIKVDQSAISLKNSVVHNNANNGLWLVNSPSVVDNVQFADHIYKTVGLDPKGIFVEGGTPTIENSLFKNNTYGIYIDNFYTGNGQYIPGNPTFENNQFDGSIKLDIFSNVLSPSPAPTPTPTPDATFAPVVVPAPDSTIDVTVPLDSLVTTTSDSGANPVAP